MASRHTIEASICHLRLEGGAAKLDEEERALLLALVSLEADTGRTLTDEERKALDQVLERAGMDGDEITAAVKHMVEAETKKDLFKIFDKQAPEPKDVDKIMKNESPPKGYNNQIQPRIDRYTKDYREMFTETKSQFSQKDPDLIDLKHRVNRLLNLHPYATYSWKTTRKSSKKSLKGKGEGKKNPSFQDLVDKPTKSFNDQDAFDSFVETREELFKF